MKKTVFVLGAGFSVAAQFPLVRDLTAQVLNFIQVEQHDSYAPFINPNQGFIRGQFYDGLYKVDPTRSLGFEEILIELRKRFTHVPQRDSQHITDAVLRIGCARLLWHRHRSIGALSPCYLNFARRVFKPSEGRHHAVVSFNWDVLFERSLQDESVQWSYALGCCGVAVLKPHGSINWNSHRMAGDISDYPYWRPISPNSKISVDVSQILSDPDPDEANPQFRRMLYPGDPDLPEQDESLGQLWSYVEAAIQNCEQVVFIGYSLPEYDSFAAQTFQKLTVGKDVEVYNPSSEQLDRFRAVLGNQVQLFLQKFEESPYAK